MAKKDMLKGMLCNLIFALIPFSSGRAKFIKKHNILDMCGENLFFQPRSLPTDPKCVRFHNDVVIAADVKFICHDVIYLNMRRCGYSDAKQHLGCIEVMDNAFIGAKAIVLPNVRIGKNAIVAAGSIVNKDVPDNCIVGGCPAKVIGNSLELMKERAVEGKSIEISDRYNRKRIQSEWDKFLKEREK